jgi:hypothetical protein
MAKNIMSFCLLCIANIYLSGSLGIQDVSDDKWIKSNDYGLIIGRAELVTELNNGLFVKGSHVSGVNYNEKDYGMNTIEVGGKIFLFKRN